jgi:hypothetical protein
MEGLDMDIRQLKRNLEEAKETLSRCQSQGNVSLADFEAVSQAERELAAAMGEQYAIKVDMGVVPDAAISGAVLHQDERVSFLAFNAMGPVPGGLRHEEAGLAIVELVGCLATRFGHPNDEALPGHPLYHRGLGAYGIYEVHNSLWCDEVVRINRVSFPKTDRSYCRRHFMFVFHDSSFECLAQSIELEIAPFSPRFEKVNVAMDSWFRIEDEL